MQEDIAKKQIRSYAQSSLWRVTGAQTNPAPDKPTHLVNIAYSSDSSLPATDLAMVIPRSRILVRKLPRVMPRILAA